MRTEAQRGRVTVAPVGFPATPERYTGPRTGDYLPALGVPPMPQIAPADLPPYTGPVTGEFLAPSRERPGAAKRLSDDRAPRHLGARLWELRYRLTIFAANGMNVFAVGLLIQVILVRYAGMGHVPSYIAQTIVSVQLSFLLSRYLTWRDRNVPFLRALARFNVQQFAITGLGMAGYAGLERLGVNYIAANVGVTAVLTPVSFLSSHKWSMDDRTHLRRWVVAVPRPLLAVLAIQAVLSLRLVWSNTAFQDEALYLWAGHLEWAHWLHGTDISVAALPTYFSGAPVVYPPIGALADSIGGLAGARLLSLALMLGATVLLYVTARRLFGSRAALFAAALFAGTGSVQFLGAFATYDAMALFLLALASWTAISAADARGIARCAVLCIAAGVMLALADAAKYAAALFDPVVLGLVFLVAWRAAGTRRAAAVSGAMTTVTALLLAAGLRLGGSAYWHGITTTTLTRASQDTPAPGVLFISAKWIGAVAFLAVCGALVALWSRRWPDRLLGCLLAAAVFLAPAEQARIHQLTSLFKHVGFGAWFGCTVAGYALAALLEAVPLPKARRAAEVAVAAVVVASVSGVAYAGAHFAVWPSSSRYIATLRPWLTGTRGPALVDVAQIPEYYLHLYSGFAQITNSSYFAYTDPVTGRRLTSPPAAYADAIRHRYFVIISLVYGNASTVYDHGIVADIVRYGGYRLVSSVPYRTPTDSGRFVTWVRSS